MLYKYATKKRPICILIYLFSVTRLFLVWRRRWSTAESQRPRRDRRFFLKFFWFLLPNSSKNMKFEWKNYAEDSIRHFVFILLWGFSIVKRKFYAISNDYLVHKLVCFDWTIFCFYIISPKKLPKISKFSKLYYFNLRWSFEFS